jgi:hypothetical protein
MFVFCIPEEIGSWDADKDRCRWWMPVPGRGKETEIRNTVYKRAAQHSADQQLISFDIS